MDGRPTAIAPASPAQAAPAAASPAITITHEHKAKSSFFRMGFGTGCGCLTVVALALGGCMISAGWFVKEVEKNVREAKQSIPPISSSDFNDNNNGDDDSKDDESIPEETQSDSIPEKDLTLAIGETHDAPEFSLSLTSAQIDHVALKLTFGDDSGRSADRLLILTFDVKNTHGRKILNFREGNQFMRARFLLTDDVDNRIRGISFGIDKPLDELSRTDDISPGEERKHVEVFNVPPPKTEFLTLEIDLKTFGGEGIIKYKIPASSIEGFGQ